MLQPPPARIHQGAVYGGVPIAWIRPPLWVMRPRSARMYDDMVPRRVGEVGDAFSGDEGREVLLAHAKVRPVVVLSTHSELRRLRQVRVIPLYSYREGSAVGRLEREIRDGKVGAAFHLAGDETLGIHDGALRLDQMQSVDGELLDHPVATLSDAALAGLIDHVVRFVRTLDRRAVS